VGVDWRSRVPGHPCGPHPVRRTSILNGMRVGYSTAVLPDSNKASSGAPHGRTS